MTTSLVRRGDDWEVRFDSARVERFVVDYDLQLEAGLDDGRLLVRIGDETTFEFHDKERLWKISPRDLSVNARVFILMGRQLNSVIIRADGSLEMSFAESQLLRVPPIAKYEAWELHGPHGIIVVSGPDGEVTTWS
jgi:hypothetical protein